MTFKNDDEYYEIAFRQHQIEEADDDYHLKQAEAEVTRRNAKCDPEWPMYYVDRDEFGQAYCARAEYG